MEDKLDQIIRDHHELVSVAVQEVLSRDYWAGIKKRAIYDVILLQVSIDPEAYHRQWGEEFGKVVLAMRAGEPFSVPLFEGMERTEQTVFQYVNSHLPELDIEHYERTFETQTPRYHYQQCDYRERLLEVIATDFSGQPFTLPNLCRALAQRGKPTKENSTFVRNTLKWLSQIETLKRKREKNTKIWYQLTSS